MQPTSDKKRKFPWIKLALALSLGVNLLVAGLAVGAALRFGHQDKLRVGGASIAANLVRTLPKDDRRAVFAELRSSGAAPKKQRRADAEALTKALRRSPFDPDQVLDVLERESQKRNDWMSEARAVWLARVSAMDEEERAAYADRLFKALTRPRHGKPARQSK